jgi:hypothetical protein
MDIVRLDGGCLEHMRGKMRNDREVAMEAVKNNGFAFLCVGYKLKGDRELLLTAIKHDDEFCRYVVEKIEDPKKL